MKIQTPNQYEDEINNLKCIFYGQSGSGKTTLLSSFPEPLVIDLEGGLGKNRPTRLIIENYADFEVLIDKLKTETFTSRFQTIGIDSLNELIEVLIRDEILTYDTKRIYNDQLTQGDYGKIARDIGKLIRRFILELSPFYHLVFTCAENQISYEGEQRTLSIVGKVLPVMLPRLMDIVGCVFTKGNDHYMTIGNSSFALGKNRYGVSSTPFKISKNDGYDQLVNTISDKE